MQEERKEEGKPTREEILADRERIKARYSEAVAERYDEACERDDDYGQNIVMMDDMEDAMVGTTVNAAGIVVPVYERELCIMSLARKYMASGDYKDEGEAYSAAADWFGCNTERAIPYLKDRAPVIIDGFDRDMERWEEFLDG